MGSYVSLSVSAVVSNLSSPKGRTEHGIKSCGPEHVGFRRIMTFKKMKCTLINVSI